jgi:hypothetical protein
MQWRMPVDSMFTFKTMAVGPDGALYFSGLNPKWKPTSTNQYLAKYSFHPVAVETLSDKKGLRTACLLAQNFPNPFNPSTTISYTVPVDGPVTLAVYDFMGRQVSELVNENKPAGAYSVAFDASNLASGTYVYRLSMGDKVLTRTMTLSK